MRILGLTLSTLLLSTTTACAQTPAAAAPEANQPATPDSGATLAAKFGADERGMRSYVLVVLKTGPNRVADGEARDALFKGHFANMKRLAAEGKLAVAGPFGDKSDWRGLFILAVESPEEAATLVATDPVIQSGEMVAEYHRLYASAALMGVNALHEQIAPEK